MKKSIVYTFRGLGIFMALFVLAGWLSTFFPTTPEDLGYAATPTPFVVDPGIVAVGAKVGLTEAQLAEAHAQYGSCNDTTSLGCYYNETQTMYIEASRIRSSHLPTTIAHEWLHFYWYQKLSDSGRKTVGDSLMVMYNRNDNLGWQLRQRMEPYLKEGLVPGTDEFNTELHSFWCTEVADYILNPSSLQYCSKLIPGRNALENTIY